MEKEKEYFVLKDNKFDNIKLAQELSQYNKGGWELIAVTPVNANGSTIWINYVMQREI